jgi:hypothetical protein
MAAGIARRRAARVPRAVLRDGAGHARVLEGDDPAAAPLLAAAERLIFAAQRGSQG